MSKEQLFDEHDILLSTTDLDSKIKYANKSFCKIAGYSADELVSHPHNMVRHPDMPKAAFQDLWQYIQSGSSWMGPVKNSCKNGDYYWVNAFVTPIKNENGKIDEYQSVRTKPDREIVERAEKTYQQINAGKTPFALRFSVDLTLWFQLFFICTFAFSLFVATLSEISLFISIPMVVISLVFSLLFFNWRLKFQKLIKEAKSVFDNPLMAYLYSGNNNAISAITLALSMRGAELKAIVGRVCDVSEDVIETAQESAECGRTVSSVLAQQAAEIEHEATAMNQMSSTVQELSRAVEEAAQTAQKGLDFATQGHTIIDKNIIANNELAEQLHEVEQAVERLIDGSKTIGTVLNEINGIADQTNLLALNAAIEAARAGEHGRGFAVVADEVRALAMRTQQSTSEINNLLTQLQSESESANKAMIKGNTLSDNCVQLSKDTGKTIDQTMESVRELADLNTQIATAVQEQSAVSEEINRNIESISGMAGTSEQSSLHSVELSNKLLTKLKEQQSLVTQFL
jgi:methyl-accepting chemotaxis protein